VLRVIDGNTFEARVRIRSGMDVSTRVRLAASMRRSCTRVAPTRLLAEGG